ncbi:Mobile element protein [Janthinobacterium sp. CG23_2]|nr:Mobile element protein [Janthinobacterium sp. CG23_2]CUU32855.1 Mobile element protein [Janthinobacterium sp. CG23_2]
MDWIDGAEELPLSRQRELAEVPRATVYRRLTAKVPEDAGAEDLLLCRLIDEEYTSRPFYGGRRMVVFLRAADHLHPVGAGIRLLSGGDRLVQPQGPVLAAQQQHGRLVLVDCLEDALREHGKPEVFNSDQGSQFTSKAFTDVLKREGVDISMDGRGRALDNIFVERLWRNVKYEDVYLKGYANMAELMVGLAQYFAFYNAERPHQSLGYETPASVYRSGVGGGALIVDKYGDAEVGVVETVCG